MSKLKVLELFGGIGACSKALKRMGIDYEIADYVEIDKYAVKSFNAIHNTNFEPQDICEWNKDIEVDLIMHGSPCQDFSTCGKSAGGDEGSGTRSSLMYETLRIVEKIKPKYVIWENVRGLLNKNNKHNFDNYIIRMKELGYTSNYQILNARNFGIPQDRNRVITVSILDNQTEKHEVLSVIDKDLLGKFMEQNVDNKYYLTEKQLEGMRNWKSRKNPLDNIYTKDSEYVRTIVRRSWGDLHAEMGLYQDEKGIRKFTEKEVWKLMGFDDEDYEKAAKVSPSKELYQQAGNSIVVNVLEAILNNLLLNERKIKMDREELIGKLHMVYVGDKNALDELTGYYDGLKQVIEILKEKNEIYKSTMKGQHRRIEELKQAKKVSKQIQKERNKRLRKENEQLKERINDATERLNTLIEFWKKYNPIDNTMQVEQFKGVIDILGGKNE